MEILLYNQRISIDSFAKIGIALRHVDLFYTLEGYHEMSAFTIFVIVSCEREASKLSVLPFNVNVMDCAVSCLSGTKHVGDGSVPFYFNEFLWFLNRL